MLITMTATRYETPTTFYLNGSTYDVPDAVAYQFVGADVARFVTVESRVVQQGTRSRVSYNIIEAPDSANPLAFTEELGSGLVNVGSAYYIRNTPTFEYHTPSGKIRQSRALGHRAAAIAAADSPYTMDGLPEVLLINATAGNVTVTLPSASFFGTGYASRVVIRRTDTTSNVVTIQRAGSDTVNGGTSITIAENSGQTLVSNGSTAWVTADVTLRSIARMSVTADPGKGGFYADATATTSIIRLRDRLFVGEGAKHTGRQSAPYGGTFLGTNVGTWFEKNAQMSVLSTEERIGILGAVQATGSSGPSAIGIAGVCYNERNGGAARSIYADATLVSPGFVVYAMEVAVSNRGSDVQANSYTLLGGAIGIHMTPEGGSGYTLGDSDTAGLEATAPATVAVNIGTGTGGTANKKWNLGIRFANNGLTPDGSGNMVAMSMGQKQAIAWEASATVPGAKIRSDVTAVAGKDMGILFANDTVAIKGTGMAASVAEFSQVASAVNYFGFTSAAATTPPTLKSLGTDTNISIFYSVKGTAAHRFFCNGGVANEDFRVGGIASAPVNFLHIYGGNSGSSPVLSAAGAGTDLDIVLTPKGTGVVRFGTWTSNADAAVNGYVTIRDAAGTARKLATIA